MTRYLTGAAVLSACVAVSSMASAQIMDECTRIKEQELQMYPFLRSIIPCSYVKEYRPPTERATPVQVEFTMFIQDINSINAADMDFRIDMFLHMTWEDRRLNLSTVNFITGRRNEQDYITLPAYAIDFIWTPDPYVTNSKDSAITKLTTTYASVTIYRNHTIRYSARVYSIVGCQMEFREYPMDVQTCSLIMQSFIYSQNEVEFNWRKWSPVMINKELKLLQFSLRKPLNNFVKNQDDELGHGEREVQQLVVELEFSREIGHHVVQTFVPSFLVVALSWFSFWLGLEAIPGRVTLLVTSMLTLTTLFTGIKEGLPPVAYVKAIDVWMAGCMVFVFAALGEFVVVRVLNVMHTSRQIEPAFPPPTPVQPIQTPPATAAKYDQRSDYLRRVAVMSNGTSDNDDKTIEAENNKINQTMSSQENGSYPRVMSVRSRQAMFSAWDAENGGFRQTNNVGGGRFSLAWVDNKTGEKKILWKEIDKASRIVFPLMFLLFMVIYFPILLSRAF